MTDALVRALAQAMADDEFVACMESCARAFPDYRARLPLIPYSYTRTRLIATPRFEVVVMQWAPGSVSAIHDHGSSRCWVLMLEGTLEVQNFECDGHSNGDAATPIRPAGSFALRAGDLDWRWGPRELHRVHNLTAENAYSLQLYAEPIGQYTIVDERSNQRRTVTATHDLVLTLA